MTEGGDSERTDDGEEDRSHLSDVPDGCGCAELWEHLSERREEERTNDGGE